MRSLEHFPKEFTDVYCAVSKMYLKNVCLFVSHVHLSGLLSLFLCEPLSVFVNLLLSDEMLHLRRLRTMQQRPLYDNHPRMPQCFHFHETFSIEHLMVHTLEHLMAELLTIKTSEPRRCTTLQLHPDLMYRFICALINLQSCKCTINT